MSYQLTSMHADVNRKSRKGTIVHHVPGRLRIKLAGDPSDSGVYSDITNAIKQLPGVDSVRINANSSSIIVRYLSPDVDFHTRLKKDLEIGNWLSLDEDNTGFLDESLCDSSPYSAQHSRLAEAIVSVAETLDVGLLRASDGYLDFKVLLPLGIAIATSLHRARGRGTPMWISLSTFAFNSFMTLHHRRINKTMDIIISKHK